MTRDERVAELSRMPKHKLIILCRTGVRRPDGGAIRVDGAAPLEEWSKDDLISTVLSIEYPAEGDPVNHDDAGGWRRCPQCRRLFTAGKAEAFHVGPDGECLDPVTARRPHGGYILSIVQTGPGGEMVWGWPRKVLDARPGHSDDDRATTAKARLTQ